MQTITQKHADKNIRLKTTDGTYKTITFSITPDDGLLFIILRTKGKYMLKLGYCYTFIGNVRDPITNKYTGDNYEEKLDKYITREKILDGKDSHISIPIGWHWTAGYDDGTIDDSFWEKHDGGKAWVDVFDVINLEVISE